VIVTGGSRGLGRGIAIAAAGQGHSVVINFASRADAADETRRLCEERRQTGEQVFLPVRADVSDPAGRAGLLETARARLGRVDALVNNAGLSPERPADPIIADPDSFRRIMATNLEGPHFLTQLVATYWLDEAPAPLLAGGFAVVFVTSIAAHTPSLAWSDYSISKAALSMARQLWAARLAPHRINVFEVRPGVMDTDMTSGGNRKGLDQLIRQGRVPQRRWGTPDDVGAAVAALLRGDLRFSTGAVIDVDGGFQLRYLP
jgi:NAD(P)-dependent dehydrogenase (short-subunit alcohol dehydrogenase family)